MSLELGGRIKSAVENIFDPALEVGRIYELRDVSKDPHQVKLLTLYSDSIMSAPEELKGKVVYVKLGQGGKYSEEIISSEEDFKKLYVKLPKGIDVTDGAK